MITTLDEKHVRARVRHLCSLSMQHIDKGEVHFTQTNADGRDIGTYRAHVECDSKLSAYWSWCGIDLKDVHEDDRVDDSEFRRFLAETSTMHKERYA